MYLTVLGLQAGMAVVLPTVGLIGQTIHFAQQIFLNCILQTHSVACQLTLLS